MTPPAMSRTVMIIDDHQVVSLGVRSALLDAGVADDALWLPAVDPARIPTGAVVVLDLRLNDDSSPRDNITALSGAGHPVVVYTSAENPCLVREAIAAGALAIVRKSAPPSSRCVAKLCRRECGEIPAARAASRTQSSRRRVTSELERRRPFLERKSARSAGSTERARRARSV